MPNAGTVTKTAVPKAFGWEPAKLQGLGNNDRDSFLIYGVQFRNYRGYSFGEVIRAINFTYLQRPFVLIIL